MVCSWHRDAGWRVDVMSEWPHHSERNARRRFEALGRIECDAKSIQQTSTAKNEKQHTNGDDGKETNEIRNELCCVVLTIDFPDKEEAT